MGPETPFPAGAERFECFAFRVFDAARVEDVLAKRTQARAVRGTLAKRT